MRLVIAAALALSAPAAAGAQAVEIALRPGEVLLNVAATGEDRSAPDVMEIRAGVVTTGTTARQALQANNALAERLIEAVRSNGVAARDVRTASLSVRPRFNQGDEGREEEGRPPRILGYVAENSLELRLRELGRAGDIIGALFSAGANRVDGPTFSHSSPDAARARARADAVRKAQAEATAYADALGMRVGRVLRLSQRGAFEMEAGSGIVVTGSRINRTPVEPGEISTEVQVWIDYALAPK